MIWVELHKQFALDVSRAIARWGITTSLALTVLIGYHMDHRIVNVFLVVVSIAIVTSESPGTNLSD